MSSPEIIVDVLRKLVEAVEVFYRLDDKLVTEIGGTCARSPLKGLERTCAFRIGTYLSREVEGEHPVLTVDMEYNRHGRNTKSVAGGNIVPDLVVHTRGNDDQNLLACEFKSDGDSGDDDFEKLLGLTDYRGSYKYRWGVFVGLGARFEKTLWRWCSLAEPESNSGSATDLAGTEAVLSRILQGGLF